MAAWAKTKILVYNQSENEEKYKEMEKLHRLGLPPKEDGQSEPSKEWTNYAFWLDDILDFFEDVDKSAFGGTKVLTVDGRSFTIKDKFNQVFMAVIGRFDEMEEDDDWEVYFLEDDVEVGK